MKKEITYWLMGTVASIFLVNILAYFGHYEAIALAILICALCAKINRLGVNCPDHSSYLCGCIVVGFFFYLALSLPILGYINGRFTNDLLNINVSSSVCIIFLFTILGLGFEEISPNHKEISKYVIGNSLDE